MPRLDLTRTEILSFRRRVGNLDSRLPSGRRSLHMTAWAGLQDSMPRAALLSIHARVEETPPTVLDDDALVQVWGPRYSVFVVAFDDLAVFTLGRLPDAGRGRERAETMADRLDAVLAGRRMPEGEVGKALGLNPNAIKYAAPTGRLLIRWDGARQSEVWTVPPPMVDHEQARLELARRFLHVFGPATPVSYAKWAGVNQKMAEGVFDSLDGVLLPVQTPIGEAWILAEDEESIRSPKPAESPPRLLPSGDSYFLLSGDERALLVADEINRASLWPSRVWPGAVLLGDEIVGTWRRSSHRVTIWPWKPLAPSEAEAVEAEASSLPLPGLEAGIQVRWEE